MSEIKVDTIGPRVDNGTLTIGASGDTVNIAGTAGTGFPTPTSGIAASAIDSGTIATARLGSGTASSSTFLRGDQTYAAPAGFDIGSITGATASTAVPITTDEHIMNIGGALRRVDHNIVTAVNTPWLQSRGLTGNQSIATDTNTAITNWNNITINSKQDSGTSSQSLSSNGQFTVGVAGYYQINLGVRFASVGAGKNIRIMIYSPHDDVTYIINGYNTGDGSVSTHYLAGSIVLPAGSSRYFQAQCYHNNGSAVNIESMGCSFSVYRIAGYDLP